jgi:DNA-binding response OmpR family regulator
MHILIIERDEQIGKILCDIFSDYDFTCKVLTDLNHAEAYLKTFLPDIVMIDVFKDSVGSIINMLDKSFTKLILTSTLNTNKELYDCNYFLLKPFSFEQLEKIILELKNSIDIKTPFRYSERKLKNLNERKM